MLRRFPPFNGGGLGFAPEVVGNPAYPYRLELLDENAQPLVSLGKFFNGSWNAQLNQPHTLTFNYPFDEYASLFHYPHQVILLDKDNYILERFVIQNVDTIRNDSGVELQVECQSLMCLLNNHIIQNYTVDPSTPKNLNDIVIELLNKHANATGRIRFGIMDADLSNIQMAPSFQGSKLLKCLLELRETAGGSIWVSPYGYLHWELDANTGENLGQQIRYKKNLCGITRTMNIDNLCTRGYFYGEGSHSEDRITLMKDSVYPTEYYDSNTGAYGIIENIYVNKEIKEPDMLLDWAKAVMKEVSQPTYIYSVDMVDLSKGASDDNYIHEWLNLGNTVTVIDEVLGINVECKVLSITRNLDNPLDIQVELSNKRKTVADTIAKLAKDVNTINNADFVKIEGTENRIQASTDGIKTLVDLAAISTPATSVKTTYDAYGRVTSGQSTLDLGTDTNGEYTKNITGTTGNIVVTGGTGEGSTANIDLANHGTAGTWNWGTTDNKGRVSNPQNVASGVRFFEDDTYAHLVEPPAGITYVNGDMGRTTGNDQFYFYRNNAWRVFGTFTTTVTPKNIGELIGDMWCSPSTGIMYSHAGSYWEPMNRVTGKLLV